PFWLKLLPPSGSNPREIRSFCFLEFPCRPRGLSATTTPTTETSFFTLWRLATPQHFVGQMKFTRLVLGLAFPPLLAANSSNDNDNNENSVTCGVDRRLGGEAFVDEFSGGKAEGTLMLQVGGQRYQQPSASASIGTSAATISQAPKLPAAAPSTSPVPAATSSSLCSSGRLLPEFYILGVPKCGTTSLAELAMRQLGVQPAIMPRYKQLAAAYDGEFTDDDSFYSQKEFHFFDFVSKEAPAEVLGNATHVRELWLR
ncbi:unnamed protein product, partial [Polarella glacialis]